MNTCHMLHVCQRDLPLSDATLQSTGLLFIWVEKEDLADVSSSVSCHVMCVRPHCVMSCSCSSLARDLSPHLTCHPAHAHAHVEVIDLLESVHAYKYVENLTWIRQRVNNRVRDRAWRGVACHPPGDEHSARGMCKGGVRSRWHDVSHSPRT